MYNNFRSTKIWSLERPTSLLHGSAWCKMTATSDTNIPFFSVQRRAQILLNPFSALRAPESHRLKWQCREWLHHGHKRRPSELTVRSLVFFFLIISSEREVWGEQEKREKEKAEIIQVQHRVKCAMYSSVSGCRNRAKVIVVFETRGSDTFRRVDWQRGWWLRSVADDRKHRNCQNNLHLLAQDWTRTGVVMVVVEPSRSPYWSMRAIIHYRHELSVWPMLKRHHNLRMMQ